VRFDIILAGLLLPPGGDRYLAIILFARVRDGTLCLTGFSLTLQQFGLGDGSNDRLGQCQLLEDLDTGAG
jgi:hypothetical protein